MRNMTRNKRHGVIKKDEIISAFRLKGFHLSNFEEGESIASVTVTKDYSSSFNIPFEGLIKLKVIIHLNMYNLFSVFTFPIFYETSNLIPKKAFYHVYKDGSLCYAPPQRPLDENWNFIDFVNAVDSLIYNYFSIEYIGKGTLKELEHGYTGLRQYNYIKDFLIRDN